MLSLSYQTKAFLYSGESVFFKIGKMFHVKHFQKPPRVLIIILQIVYLCDALLWYTI